MHLPCMAILRCRRHQSAPPKCAFLRANASLGRARNRHNRRCPRYTGHFLRQILIIWTFSWTVWHPLGWQRSGESWIDIYVCSILSRAHFSLQHDRQLGHRLCGPNGRLHFQGESLHDRTTRLWWSHRLDNTPRSGQNVLRRLLNWHRRHWASPYAHW